MATKSSPRPAKFRHLTPAQWAWAPENENGIRRNKKAAAPRAAAPKATTGNAADKAWKTRRAAAVKRSAAAVKANETRRARQAAAIQSSSKRKAR